VALPVAGRYWKLDISCPANFAQTQADQGMISSAIVFGIAIVLLLAIIFYFQTQNRREQLLEQSKDEFVSLASHQLRAPLTSIHLFVEMMLDEQVGKLTDKQREYLTNVSTSTSRLTDLVTEFLNISALELGQLNVKTQFLNLEDIVENSIKQFLPAVVGKNLTISFNKPDLPKVAIDPNLYAQIVNNLISNAINYSSRNDHIDVYLHKEQSGFQLDVKDNGIGITADAKDKVFERFYRADNAKRETSNGTGLGLYLVKLIVDMCNGKTWYESTEGHGSTFHVIIPLSGMSSIAKHTIFKKAHGRISE
jgi:two-component system phosphate regulon sensor histidine kinase PhoR